MRAVRRGVAAVVVATVLLASAGGPALASGLTTTDVDLESRSGGVSSASALDDASTAAQQDTPDDNVTVTQAFRRTPNVTGSVVVEHRFDVPDRVVSMNTSVPENAAVVRTDGFTQESERRYAWDESTANPSITYTLQVNQTLDGSSPEGEADDLRSVDAGEWALFRRPNAPTRYQYRAPDVGFRQQTTMEGSGAAGEWLVFLGEHDRFDREAHGQRFRLVVPEAADMTAPPERVLDSMAGAADALRVGDRDEEVFVVAAPTENVSWGRIRGLQRGDADMWVRADEPVNDPENAWVHEYVHTRQELTVAPELQWFEEATAAYYAAYLTLEQDRITFAQFRDRLDAGNSSHYDEAVLADQSTWNGTVSYDRGALVVGDLDRQIRRASGGNRTMQAVVRSLNDADERTRLADFLGLLGSVGDSEVIDVGQRYTETASEVQAWNESAHVDAYGSLPPRIGYQLPSRADPRGYYVSGPYRSEFLGHDARIVLVPGEQFTVNAEVTNAGGREGEYSLDLQVNGTTVSTVNGTVAANETTVAPLNHTFATPGRYQVGLDGDNVTVHVRNTANADIVNFTVAQREAREGETVQVDAYVSNNRSVPGRTRLVVSRNYQAVTSTWVNLGPWETRKVTFQVPMVEQGQTVVAVGGERPVEISVNGPPIRTLTDAESVETDAPANETVTADGNRTSPASGERGSGLNLALVGVAVVSLAAGLLVGRRL